MAPPRCPLALTATLLRAAAHAGRHALAETLRTCAACATERVLPNMPLVVLPRLACA